MLINTNELVSMGEANQNFSKVTRKVDKEGAVVILKNNSPRYVVLDFSLFEKMQASKNDKLETIAERILNENLEAFEELAK